MWTEYAFFVDRWLSESEIREVFVVCYGLTPNDITMYDPDIAQLTGDFPSPTRVMCAAWRIAGDFAQVLEITIDPPLSHETDQKIFVQYFCDVLGCTCLIPGEDPHNPLIRYLVCGTGSLQAVVVNKDILDQEHRWVITPYTHYTHIVT